MKKKILLLAFILLGTLSLVLTYKIKQNNLSKNNPYKNKKLSIMIKEDGATDYTKSSSKYIPQGNYVLNEEKTHCDNNGTVTNYDSQTGTVSFSFIGTDKCYLYFDYYKEPVGYEVILANNGGKNAIIQNGTPTSSSTGMFAKDTSYGTTYYFRGAVDNNWVSFGGYYWRIFRIDESNIIRMIYSGYTAPTESEKSVMTGTKTQIGTSKYNESEMPAYYVGYMYSSSDDHGNTLSSSVKNYIDDWYDSNLYNQNQGVLYDGKFCYDRTIKSQEVYGDITYNQNGLVCPNSNDIYSPYGNSGNTVGLITAEEANLSCESGDKTCFLYTGQSYWTMTPTSFIQQYCYVATFYAGTSNEFTINESGVRPVILIAGDLNITGDGTWNNPYVFEN